MVMTALMALATTPTGGGVGAARPSAARPPVLLAMADHYGTLAAVRSLGRAGVPVSVAEWRLLPPARWSRHVTRVLRCPDVEAAPEAFVDWLLERGSREPGQVLLPTNDDLAWLFARHRAALARHYLLDLPPLDTVYTLLNKWRLRAASGAEGLATPESWLPRDDAELAAIGREARFPLLVKPQTQVYLTPHRKGTVVGSPDELAGAYRAYREDTRHSRLLLEHDPDAGRPMLQAFVAGDGVYGLSGFVDASGELFVAAASRKVLQRPLRTGVGLCFEEAPPDAELERRLAALCRRVGFHGVFEAEFLRGPDGYLLIDFNPRFYGQMAFDVARGLDLPLLTYLAACGDRPGLRRAFEAARGEARRPGARVYCNRFQLWLFLGLLGVAGRIDLAEVRRWLGWVDGNRGRVVEAVLSADDWAPGLADATSALLHHALHLRSELRAARRS